MFLRGWGRQAGGVSTDALRVAWEMWHYQIYKCTYSLSQEFHL